MLITYIVLGLIGFVHSIPLYTSNQYYYSSPQLQPILPSNAFEHVLRFGQLDNNYASSYSHFASPQLQPILPSNAFSQVLRFGQLDNRYAPYIDYGNNIQQKSYQLAWSKFPFFGLIKNPNPLDNNNNQNNDQNNNQNNNQNEVAVVIIPITGLSPPSPPSAPSWPPYKPL